MARISDTPAIAPAIRLYCIGRGFSLFIWAVKKIARSDCDCSTFGTSQLTIYQCSLSEFFTGSQSVMVLLDSYRAARLHDANRNQIEKNEIIEWALKNIPSVRLIILIIMHSMTCTISAFQVPRCSKYLFIYIPTGNQTQ